MSQGQDMTLVYNRRRVEKESEVHTPYASDHYYQFNSPYHAKIEIRSQAIGFCGKMYFFLEMNLKDNMGSRYYDCKDYRKTRKYCYKLEDIDTYVRHYFDDEDYEAYSNREYKGKSKWPVSQKRFQFEAMFEAIGRWPNTSKAFEFYHCPIFRAYQASGKQFIVINECLKHFEFIKVFDPYAAYQELAMYLGNQAIPIKPIPKLDDKTMSEIKGFDKFSFRKDPTKKRK